MDKRLHLAFGFIVLLCLLRRTLTERDDLDDGAVRVPWYLGCYNNNEIAEDSSFKPVYKEDQITPVYCVRHCAFNESFRYAAVRNGSICFCLVQIEQDDSISHTFCNVSCLGDKNITCGGTNASSVYSTAVPLLVSLNINLPKQVKTNTSIAADSELSIKRQRDEVSNLDRIKQGNQTAGSILIEWYSGNKLHNKTQQTLDGNWTNTSTVFLFRIPGNHHVCVKASNLFSQQKRCSLVNVVTPVNGLQLVTVFQGSRKVRLSSPLLITNSKAAFFKYLIASGSHPKFRFDFGDGSSPLSVADTSSRHDSSECTCVTVFHIFKSCGNFTVNVTASNAVSLESVTEPGKIAVGMSVETLELIKNGKDCMYVEANVSSTLTVKIKQVPGCAVFFQWNFNDSSPNVTTTVPSVLHEFPSSHSVYNVTVVAYNEHRRKKMTQEVCLQDRLQGVILKPVSHMVVGITEEITFNVHLSPVLARQGTVRFKLYREDRSYPSSIPSFRHVFNTPGRYVVFADAENQVSRVISNKIVVSVLEPIIGLSICHEGTTLLGKPTHLAAHLKAGTNVTYYWEFHKGSEIISTLNTTSPGVTYNFTKKGRYKINLLATNALESKDVSIRVYVTNVPECYPPEVTILGSYGTEVNRSKEIRLEAEVTFNCSKAKELVYLWMIIHDSGSKKSMLADPDDVSFTEQVLIIPPCVLDYGEYQFQLEVKVKGTGLSAENKKRITVVKSQLVAVIEGGATKVVGRKNKKITMDASSSHDPDFPDQGHQIGFHWSCNPLGNKNTSCFNESRTAGMNRNLSVLMFPLDWLLEDHGTFEFVVTVLKDSRKLTAWQILYVDTKKPHLLSANCLQCDKGHINPSVPLVITGLCLSCPLDNTNIAYKWKLYHVGNSKFKLLDEEECRPTSPTGSDENSGMPNSGIKSTRKPSPTVPPSKSQTAANNRVVGTVFQRPTNNAVTTRMTKPSSTPMFQARFANGNNCRNPNQILGPTSSPPLKSSTRRPGFHRPPFGSGSGSGGGGGGGGGGGSGIGSGGGMGTGTGNGTGHGTASGTGSGSGVSPDFGVAARNKSKVSTTRSHQNFTTVTPTTDDDDDDDDDDDEFGNIYDPKYTPASAKHSTSIVRVRRNEMRVPEKQTTTGLKSQNFVLLDKFLRGGHTYMVAFNVLDGITGQRGKASVYFNTSKVPECGLCTITPSVGVALVTTFQLTCSKWTPLGKWPLSYHLSYSIDGDSEKKKILIYSGYRSAVPFVLPPGLASFNHRVQIYVTVASGAGTKQRMQPSIVRVSPQTAKEGVTMEEVLLNKTVGKYLSMLREAGNEQGVRQFITALANSLNRLGSVKNVSSKFILRLEIRKTLLLFIRNLTVNDKNSAFQTCLALQTLTASPEELAESSIETASDILQHLGEVMQATQRSMRAKRIEDRFLLSQEFIQTMTRVTSNLIEAASILIHRNTGTPFVRRETKDNVLLRATEAAQKLIKAKLSMRVLGEQPLLVTTPYIWVNATQLASVGNSLFSLGDVKFHMPTNLEKELNTVSVGSEGSCYGTMMTVYKENPFFSEMHHTKVGSLSISHCNGEDIEVRNLSSGILISIPHGNHTVEHYTEEFTLQWKHENIHVINQTEKMMNQSLHVHLEPLSILPPGFVVKLITSTSKPDSSLENKNEYTVTTSGKAIDLYLGHHQLINVSGSVFARVVLEDTAYYRIKSIKKGPSFSYLLSVKWMGCFYWNNKDKDWSSDGCEMMDDSTDKMLFCRCNHLTAFSGAFMYPPNSITIEDLRDTEKLKKAPVTMILVVSIMVLYLVLLGFCVRADKHDKKKLGAVYINENTAVGIPQRFQITVQTGHWFGAGTSANVFLVLHDDDRVSDPIELKSATGKPMFERSSCDVFVLSLPGKSLSNIWKIHIWHDNSGEHPSWFLEQVVITDVNNGDKRFFNCNRWLAVDEADGKVECELLETSGHCSSFRQSFAQHSSKSIMDYHLWLSLFGRPSYSRFSRAQRLTCCVSLLLSFLCVNIAWYRPKTEVAEVLGIVDVTAESIWIGVLCSILALPVNLLWIFLFRYSRRSFRHHVKVYPISEPQTDTTELVSSSVLDQSLETVLILKNIGERKRWFQTVWELDDVQSDTSSCMGHYGVSPERASDSSSLGYNSGQGALSSADAPLPTSHAGLLETCDFLADIAPSRKKSMDFEKRSFYSVSLSSNASEGRGVYRSRFSLPHVCVYVAWFGCLLTAGTAGVFTVLYGVSFGWDLSIRWLQSLIFSLLESFLVSQPIMVVVFILFMAYKSNTRKDDEDVDEGFEDLSSSALHDIHYGHLNQGFEDEISRDEDDLNPALALRRRQRYLKFLKPPSKSNLSEARSKCVQSRALWNYTIELMVFILFLLVTCLLVASVTNPDVYHLNKSIKKAFLRSEDSSLTGPGSVKDAWKEISSALHENSASSSYTPFTILLRDSQSLLFGRTRITQYNTGLLTTCGEASRSGNQTFCHARCHAKDGTWLSLELNQSSNESAKQLKEITDSQWINTCTREIDVEFAVYTPLLRAISAATLTVKASFTGKPECHLELNTFPAFSESMEHGYFLRVCKLVFVVLHLYFIQHEFFLALTMSRKYFTSFWRLTQLLTVGLTSLCILLYIRWSVCLYALLREVETTSQTQVYYYAKLVSWSQETLQASYGLLLFFLIIRCVYLLRPFRTIVRLGKYFANIVRPLVACTVVMVIFMMSFAHTGHLLFGRLHSAFKSFGEAFLLVSGFFRLEGVNRYQGPAVEEHPVLFLCYFALFLIGFCVFMRGTTAAVFVCGIPQSRKRRNKILADFVEDFIRSKLQTLREKAQRRDRTDSTSDEEEDEDLDEELELELETYEQDAPFPMEHVLDEVDDQIQELSLRMDNLMGSDVFDDRCYSEDMLSFADSEDDVEYLYQAEQPSPVGGSGYDSDHSNMSAAKWQFSSSSSNDMSDYCGKHQSPGPEHQASARPVKFTLGGCELHGLGLASSSSGDVAVHPSEKMKFKDNSDRSCSSCYEMSRSNACFTDHVGEGLLTRSTGNQRPFALRDDVLRDTRLRDAGLRDAALRDGELRGGVLRDGVWYVGDLRGVVHDSFLRDDDLPGKTGVASSISSDDSFVMRPIPDKEPIKPKAMYGGLSRTHGRRGVETLAPDSADSTTTDAATNSSPDQEVGKKTKKSHLRRTKGLFRSSAVYPGHEGFVFGPIPPRPHRTAHRKDSGLNTAGESSVQAAWGLAPSASERGFLSSPDPHVINTPACSQLPSASEQGFVRSPDLHVPGDSAFNSPAWGLAPLTSPDPLVPVTPLKGILGDISMNKRLGTEIPNDDSPASSTSGDKY